MALKFGILGANGFIGSRTVEMFHLADLAEVRPIVRHYSSLAGVSRFNLDYRIADAFDQAALRKAFSGCDVVLHTVAGDPKTILGTLTPTYQAAQEAGVRCLIYLSSASVHGQAPIPGSDENSPLNDEQPLPYNKAKVEAERKLHQLRSNGEVELVILRPGIVFGPRSYWVASFAESLLQGTAYLIDGGRGICNSIYIDNLVHAIYLAATQPGIDGEAFLVGDSETITWAKLYEPIAQALGFDFAQIPEATLPKPKAASLLDRSDAIRMSKPVQTFLSIFPMKLRQVAYMGLMTLRPIPPTSPWNMPQPEKPVASLEMSLLYQCQYKLPHTKATQRLGYEPPISFPEGCRRTVAWLDFAGYPVSRISAPVDRRVGA